MRASRTPGVRITIFSALNRAFGEWHEVFPNAACVVSLVDRLVHNAEIIAIEGESYRLKEARDRTEARARKRRAAKA
jgi:DNA replication protein DnaC